MQAKYRPDIDGLRAIAVSLVLFFHAWPRFLPGGFVGVDVFFVIPGYLITGIIFRDASEGNFSYLNFYARRLRRITQVAAGPARQSGVNPGPSARLHCDRMTHAV